MLVIMQMEKIHHVLDALQDQPIKSKLEAIIYGEYIASKDKDDLD